MGQRAQTAERQVMAAGAYGPSGQLIFDSHGDALLVKWLVLPDPMLRIGSSIPTADTVRKTLALSVNRPCG